MRGFGSHKWILSLPRLDENHYALLVNPVAGNGKGRSHLLNVKSVLEKKGIHYGEFLTANAGDEQCILIKAIQNHFRNFIIIGGDGTLSKVIDSFLRGYKAHARDFTFGVIPAGTGNDWCRHHGISRHPAEALEIILRGHSIFHDAGIIRSGDSIRFFINMAGTGFQGYVVKQITESKSAKTSRLFYYLKVLQYIFSYKSCSVSLISEERQIKEPVFSIAAGICRYNGGGMMQTPDAVADDGLLDVTVIKRMPLLQLLLNFPKISSGNHVKHPMVSVFKTKHLAVESSHTIFADADGELSFPSPFQFSMLPRAVRMIVP
jgi:YegS/Rv2252/BmrU family lipid kinase